jgi:hypothetical protein
LKPFQRRKLLSESENLISKLIDEEISKVGSIENVSSKIVCLDSSHTDLELIEIWNSIYDDYGFRFDLFKDKLIKENLKGIKDYENNKDDSNIYTPLKIDWLERRKMKRKVCDFG